MNPQNNYAARLKKIITAISQRTEFKTGHQNMQYPKGTIGYYVSATSKPTEYFVLKYDNMEWHHKGCGGTNSFEIEYDSYGRYDTFDADKWIKSLEEIVMQGYLVKDGKTYLLVPVDDIK